MKKYKRSKEGEANRLASIPRGKKHWRYDHYNIKAIHKWIRKYYGKANKCENTECRKKSNCYDFALIKGRKYLRKRENYKMLCRGCHVKYDMTKKRRLKMSILHKNVIWTQERKDNISKALKGKTREKWSIERKLKHSKLLKKYWKKRRLNLTQ